MDEHDGQTSIASRCASLLGEKGIIECNSAGNNGGYSWYYISIPADAFNILTVGSCNIDSVGSHFSSRGPSYDGRVKPDVTSMGESTRVYYYADFTLPVEGTSFASPIIAGLSACLWQALPQYSASEIMQIIRENSHCYNFPNSTLGYGIPDFYHAYTSQVGINNHNPLRLSVYPNPATDKIHLTDLDGSIRLINIYNAAGQLVLQQAVNGNPLIEINVTSLSKGFYVGTAIMDGNQTASFKFLK